MWISFDALSDSYLSLFDPSVFTIHCDDLIILTFFRGFASFVFLLHVLGDWLDRRCVKDRCISHHSVTWQHWNIELTRASYWQKKKMCPVFLNILQNRSMAFISLCVSFLVVELSLIINIDSEYFRTFIHFILQHCSTFYSIGLYW